MPSTAARSKFLLRKRGVDRLADFTKEIIKLRFWIETLDFVVPSIFEMERWLSGRRHVPAKDAYPSKGTVGSNPTLSVLFLLLT